MALRASSELALFFVLFILVSTATVSALQQESVFSANAGTSGSPPYIIKLYTPASNSIHSVQITDIINGLHRDVLFATSFGLSDYNGTWKTRHLNRDNFSEGLMDNFVTAVEYDNLGNLWIGSSGGLQVYNGIYYKPITDLQLLKSTEIRDLQRWNNDMWVATGTAGIHRFRNDSWTWFQPMSKTGPGFYEIDSMVLDSASDSLVIATYHEGLWIIRSPEDPVQFSLLSSKDSTFGNLQHVRRDPLGGAYFFDGTRVVHYSVENGFVPALTASDLAFRPITINDIAAAQDGKLYLATDDGIYIWQDGSVVGHLTRFEGIGTSAIVRTIFVDAENRVWFATQDFVGYYQENQILEPQIPIEMVTSPGPGNMSWTLAQTPEPIATSSTNTQTCQNGNNAGFLSPVLDPILRAVNELTSRFGFKIIPDSCPSDPVQTIAPVAAPTQGWIQMTANAGWSARIDPSDVAMPDGSIVLMGGADFNNYYNDVWRSTDDGATWTQITSHAGWSARAAQSSVTMPDGSIVLMGGADATNTKNNDVWRSTDQGVTWTEMTPHAAWSPRMSSSVVVSTDGSILLIGGYLGGKSTGLNDVWRSTDFGATWTQMTPHASWPARFSQCSVVAKDGSILLIGGASDNNEFNDVWRSNDEGATWTQITSHAEWLARMGQGIVIMPDGKIVLMGGGSDATKSLLNDVWQSKDYGTTWTLSTTHAGWSPRWDLDRTSIVTTDGSIILIGGSDGDPFNNPNLLNDTWRLSPSK